MARIYGESYVGPDQIIHWPYTDPDTGESGEDLSLPQPAAAEAPLQTNQAFANAGWDPRLMIDQSAQKFGQSDWQANAGATPQRSNPVQVSPNGAVTYVNTGQTVPAPGGNTPGQPGPGGTAPRAMSDYERLLADNAARQAANDAAEIAYRNAILSGQREDRAFAQGQQAWANKFAERQQGFSEQQAGIANQRAGDQTALSLLGMNANLRGPQNYLTYLRTLQNTPGGLTDLVNGLAGRFNLSSQQGSVPGSQYERASVGGLVRDLNQAQGGQPGQPGSTPQAPPDSRPGWRWTYEQQWVNDVTGESAPRAGAGDASGMALPAGGQWNANAFNVLSKNPTQIGLAQNLYSESGRDWDTELSNYLSSLPKFSGPQRAAVRL